MPSAPAARLSPDLMDLDNVMSIHNSPGPSTLAPRLPFDLTIIPKFKVTGL